MGVCVSVLVGPHYACLPDFPVLRKGVGGVRAAMIRLEEHRSGQRLPRTGILPLEYTLRGLRQSGKEFGVLPSPPDLFDVHSTQCVFGPAMKRPVSG